MGLHQISRSKQSRCATLAIVTNMMMKDKRRYRAIEGFAGWLTGFKRAKTVEAHQGGLGGTGCRLALVGAWEQEVWARFCSPHCPWTIPRRP